MIITLDDVERGARVVLVPRDGANASLPVVKGHFHALHAGDFEIELTDSLRMPRFTRYSLSDYDVAVHVGPYD